ncbi:ThiF family adenylyltransferase [Rubrobacter aplysinae]|uniref:ThiF family adenylyltransferase n=1 Tax=Rubrobacter aplysinae TaxID=909625 RepID=UPI00064BF9CD|nr:ThiF family adenylyltransferase [Rubrobacter aplysinae]
MSVRTTTTNKAKPVKVMNPARTRVVIFGVGGTGAYVTQSVLRLLYSIRQANRETTALAGGSLPQQIPEVLLVEGGEVSDRNILRQGYLPQDAGRNKALVLSERYGAAYGMAVNAYPNYLDESTDIANLVCDGAVVVGCVDNAATRRLLHEKLYGAENIVYLDSGNGAVPMPVPDAQIGKQERISLRESGWDGQVVCGARKDGETVLPFPADTFPTLIEVEDADDRHPDEIPCNELTVSAPQRMTTNLVAANVVLTYLTTLLTEGTVLNCRSLFDARQGYVRSTPAVDEMDELAAS